MAHTLDLNKILSELANDNDAPLEDLFNYYYPRLYNFSKSFLKVEDGIDDILQEVFVKIWQNRKKIDSADSFNSFIFTITRNLLLNEIRRRLNNQGLKEQIRKHALAPEFLLNNQIEYSELKEKVDHIVDKLPDRQKEIFIMSRTQGLSHKEIAEQLGVTTKTVEYHISQVIRRLKSDLKNVGILSILCFYLFF